MGTIGYSYLTLLDWAKRQKPGGGVDEIIEALSASNPILNDAAVVEGNLPTGHRTTVRSGLPDVAWRMLNYGVQPSKSTTVQVDDTCGMLEGYSKVDVDLAKLNGDEGAFRASEDDAFIESMNQAMAATLFYGNTAVDPEKFLGLAPRYNSKSAKNASNVVDAYASAAGNDQTSIWLITWGPQTCHLIFPKGSQGGIQSKDLGEQTVQDSRTPPGLYQAYVTHFQWKLGMVLRDWRYVVRVCNIDKSAFVANETTIDLIRKLVKAYYARPTADFGNMARVIWYCNKTVAEWLHVQAMNKTNVNLVVGQEFGKPVTMLLGAPVHVCDAILNNEAVVE